MTLVLALLLASAASCSNGDPIRGEGGVEGRVLRFLSVGPDVGLKPGQTRVLTVGFEGANGGALASEALSFAFYGDPRGSTLSTDLATTDSNGHAQVELRAGARETAFEVRVSADGAEPLAFAVQISKVGFATITLSLRYKGALLNDDQLATVNLRLFAGAPCAELSASDATTPLRQRSVSGLAPSVSFAALPIDRDHTVHTVAFDSANKLRAWSCLEVPKALLEEAQALHLEQALDDASPLVDGRYALVSVLQLPKANRPLAAALAPWSELSRCPYAPAQQLLDCALDARDGGDPLDCVIEAPSVETQALIAERGLLSGGCRGPLSAGGGPSIDARLAEALSTRGKSALDALAALHTDAPAALSKIEVKSKLVLGATDAAGQTVASHRLLEVSFATKTKRARYKLSAFPLAAPQGASAIKATVSGWQLELAPHDLSLRAGLLLRAALGDLLLVPRQLPASSKELVVHLAKLVEVGSGATKRQGCEAISAIACDLARLPQGCLSQACPAGLVAFAARLDAGFTALDDHPFADLELGGKALIDDGDGRLRVDRLGADANAGGAPGRWTTAELQLASEALTVKEATFTGRLASGN
ncbi:MAG: hypothetical protein CSB49_05700 [Proteobacteria bacterium]|nr:MAG: hypothetical protein CSB49_05700 [Pseudomonadota bacterium]